MSRWSLRLEIQSGVSHYHGTVRGIYEVVFGRLIHFLTTYHTYKYFPVSSVRRALRR